MQKINEINSKKQRSVSAFIKEEKKDPSDLKQSKNKYTTNDNANSANTNNNNKKGLHHRKKTSSYFLGSYIPNSNILENNEEKEDDININLNLNINNILENKIMNENSIDKEEDTESNEIKNKLLYNLINNNSNDNISLSFPSYEENNINNSITLKQQDSSNKKSNNNKNNCKNDEYNKNSIYYEMAKDAQTSNSNKSFISFKNSLKYIKDKDERTTPSYLLALQTDKKNAKNNYVTSSNIIEEEKSSMLESKSEFSNKKEIFHLEKKKLENNTNEKENNILQDINSIKDNKNNKNIINNNIIIKNYKDKDDIKIVDSNNNSIPDENNHMSSALNEIITKNNKKEEDKRKYLTKNKMTLLNKFFSMSKTLKINKEKVTKVEDYINIREKDKDINKYNEKKENANLNYYMKKNYSNNNNNKILKKSFTNKRIIESYINMDGQYLYSMNNLNNNIKLNTSERPTINSQSNYKNNSNNVENIINLNLKKNLYKIPHLVNVKKKIQRKLLNDSASNIIDTPFKKLKTTNSNNNSSSRKNSLNNSKNDRNNQKLKRLENLNNALSFIREKKKIIKTNTNADLKFYNNNNTYSISNIKNSNLNKIPSGYSTSFFTNSNSNTNTQSHSKSKEKNKKVKKILRKANSGSFNSKGELLSQSGEKISNIESNKKQIVICLKYKLYFNKLYEKIDSLEKINSTNLSNKSFFLILCDIKENQFIFSGLFKYYHDKERYIKIYGDERSPNYILLKDIKGRIKYKIYENNNQIDSSKNNFILVNHFRFTSNALIIIKN